MSRTADACESDVPQFRFLSRPLDKSGTLSLALSCERVVDPVADSCESVHFRLIMQGGKGGWGGQVVGVACFVNGLASIAGIPRL